MFNLETIAEVVGLASIAVPVTQALKKWLKLKGNAALLVSLAVSILLALWRELSREPQNWLRFGILAAAVFLESNGIYHFGSYAVGKMAKADR